MNTHANVKLAILWMTKLFCSIHWSTEHILNIKWSKYISGGSSIDDGDLIVVSGDEIGFSSLIYEGGSLPSYKLLKYIWMIIILSYKQQSEFLFFFLKKNF